MNTPSQSTLPSEDTPDSTRLYMAIDMAEKSWKLVSSDGQVEGNGQPRLYQTSVEGHDYIGVSAALKS
ncbi:hypothetical protein G3480_21690 [Thiorhodococcus mannitoliphagus]|uniref:Uncharacterized protein n=1 Tax=Thiorhodococcus mannitoliphagus TaxID=329406 RepID=A0A6P1E0P9_9GAMM|nr:hypothetical protein [Thiorhodococcus mannitoliphagus]NEX22881.1 hypothetical protein [Thiorhodococcus mannitoliphagus]